MSILIAEAANNPEDAVSCIINAVLIGLEVDKRSRNIKIKVW